MRVQYGCLNSFIVAMVTFEELFRIMSGIWVIFEYFLSSKNDEINDILTLQCILKVYFDVFFIKRNNVFSSYKCPEVQKKIQNTSSNYVNTPSLNVCLCK